MKQNMGETDRTVRLLIGGSMLVSAVVFQSWIGLIGLIPLVTAAVGYCPLYTVLGKTTNRYDD
jgi:hypothetical protein